VPRYQFVDCRWELGSPGRGRELYLEGHIPGASFLDVDEDLAAPPGPLGRHPLPEVDDFAHAASRAGIGDGVFVVAYGNMGGAERLWWLLRHFGHDDCAVLELDAWRGPFRTGEEAIEPADFTPRLRKDDTIEPGELVTYCGSGVTACVTLHRLWLSGREGRLYPGSWSEWEQLGLPVRRG
jgi:thiosulfate/3-mercaptopyruvate sulfurtransferase